MSVTPLYPPEPRTPPANTEAEQALLGSILINNAVHGRVAAFLAPEHFANGAHGRIFAAIGELIAAGSVADPITLKGRFDQDGALSQIGGSRYLVRLAEAAGTALNAEHYARAIVDAARRRALIEAGETLIDAAYGESDIDNIVSDITRRIIQPNGHDPDPAAAPGGDRLAELLDVHTWAALDIPPEAKFLGDLITPTSRTFLIGRTGLGKTLIAYGMAAGMGSGQGFLHWRCDRASRWLIIDGEMSTPLIKARGVDLIRRAGPIPPGYLTIYSLDRAEEFARLIPGLGMLQPINTEAGQQFVLRLAAALDVEGIIFDNVMSLIGGDQKDEVPWSQTLPLVGELSRRKIAQVYLDHTGWVAERQYGSATKGWRMDAAGVMTALPDDQRQRGEVAFSLSFELPAGKARRRTLDNWSDFETVVIRLAEDRWSCEATDKPGTIGKLSPVAQDWYTALLNAVSRSNTPGKTDRFLWYGEAVRVGLADPVGRNDNPNERRAKQAGFRKYMSLLRHRNLIGIDGEMVTLLRKDET